MDRLKLVLSSRNEHKRRELEAALPGWSVELLEGGGEPPAEEGETYYENARVKALFGRPLAPADAWAAGEDSGLEVEALGGEPGIHSARWSARPIDELLARLEGVEQRRARYVCELVAISPEEREVRGRGVLEGTIAHQARGSEGFGYDPIFVPVGEMRTVAELGNAWKRRNSHRARAAESLRRALAGVGA